MSMILTLLTEAPISTSLTLACLTLAPVLIVANVRAFFGR